jgi:ParB family chromosome partitioning protein
MATKRLGKGLEALIRSNSPEALVDSKVSGVSSVSISKIKTNPLQPRKEFKKDLLDDLAASIKENGVISPITVREDGKNYTLIAGERRLRASQSIGLKDIPAHIIEVKNSSDMMQLALIENIQRENLNPMEESEAYALLQDKFNFSQNQIAKSVGKSRSTITNSLRLLQLPEEVRASLKDNKISAGHARAILAAGSKQAMYKLWKQILEDNLSVRSAEDLSKKSKTVKSGKRIKKKIKSKSLLSIENELISIFGTKVQLNSKSEKSGNISIEYFTNDDLERILELIRSIDS